MCRAMGAWMSGAEHALAVIIRRRLLNALGDGSAIRVGAVCAHAAPLDLRDADCEAYNIIVLADSTEHCDEFTGKPESPDAIASKSHISEENDLASYFLGVQSCFFIGTNVGSKTFCIETN